MQKGEIEKDPTTYLLRRNYATHLDILGFEENEIQYLMGHDIEDDMDKRNFYRNEERLIEIAKKLEMRPLVNEGFNLEAVKVTDFINEKNVNERVYRIPIQQGGIIKLQVMQKENNRKKDNICDSRYSG